MRIYVVATGADLVQATALETVLRESSPGADVLRVVGDDTRAVAAACGSADEVHVVGSGHEAIGQYLICRVELHS